MLAVQHEVSEFIVIAPAGMGKSIEWAQADLQRYLLEHFPSYRFRIEPFGPFAVEDDFGVIPIMNRSPAPGEGRIDPDAMVMCSLAPSVISRIQRVLQAFDPVASSMH